jgi:hypothetical protein
MLYIFTTLGEKNKDKKILWEDHDQNPDKIIRAKMMKNWPKT